LARPESLRDDVHGYDAITGCFDFYYSVIRYRGDNKQAETLSKWLRATLEANENNILDVDPSVAVLWGSCVFLTTKMH